MYIDEVEFYGVSGSSAREAFEADSLVKDFSISPNPAVSSFTVTIPETGKKEVKLTMTDVIGNVVAEKSLSIGNQGGKVTISTSGMKNGLYILILNAGNRQYTRKVIINKD